MPDRALCSLAPLVLEPLLAQALPLPRARLRLAEPRELALPLLVVCHVPPQVACRVPELPHLAMLLALQRLKSLRLQCRSSASRMTRLTRSVTSTSLS